MCGAMELKALLLCANEKIVRVMRRTLGDLEIEVDLCATSDKALRKLTRERFEAIIVDCAGDGAEMVLRAARSAPCNRRAIAVAILEHGAGMRSAFEFGAHFILYKPVTAERAKSSFRAARALMKKERRRNVRVAVNIPVEMSSPELDGHFKVQTVDLGLGGLAVNLPQRRKLRGRFQLKFTLPGSAALLKVDAEFAWEGSGTQVGLRFENQSGEVLRHLRAWLAAASPEAEKDDPPVACRLTDLSLGGCYLESPSPFPVSTRVTLTMRAADVKLQTEGMVRVMHSERGMGVEFRQRTPDERTGLQKFLKLLMENRQVVPELLVEPEGLEGQSGGDSSSNPSSSTISSAEAGEDALLQLFGRSMLTAEEFFEELRKQRGVTAVAAAVSA